MTQDPDDFTRLLRDYVRSAQSAWPDLAICEADFAAYVRARHPAQVLPLDTHAGDLLLACACARGMPPAIQAFHRAYSPIIARVLAKRKALPHVADDAGQLVLQRLLVATPHAEAKIAEYKGAGSLRSWVAAVVTTQLLMLHRASARRREDHTESDEPWIETLRDPELAQLAERYRPEVEQAIVLALAGLTDRERLLLRLQLAEGMSIDQLGTMYAVDRATAARWLVRARKSVLQHARATLRDRLRLSETECDSLLNLVRSRLDISVLRHLESP